MEAAAPIGRRAWSGGRLAWCGEAPYWAGRADAAGSIGAHSSDADGAPVTEALRFFDGWVAPVWGGPFF